MKKNVIYSCGNCDAQFPKWIGRCTQCGAWGSIVESSDFGQKKAQAVPINKNELIALESITLSGERRTKTGMNELDRVLGGGIVEGSLILLGGEPGIGKSTLVLQLLASIPSPTLYVSGEESPAQIKIRVDRLGLKFKSLKFLPENTVEKIIAHIEQEKPALTIVDSIQTLYSTQHPSEPGSISQVRIATVKLLETAKRYNVSIIIIGHVTKEGQVAGPKTLEHLVDTVLYLEPSKNDDLRILRAVKNRFGSTQEIGVFEMRGSGLEEVLNPSQLFISDTPQTLSGNTTTCIMEGSRPFLIEIQSLVTKTLFGYPQRKSAGFDSNRMQMLAAVLMKRAGISLIDQDIHINITGGLKIQETAADLALCMAITSSLKDVPIPHDTIIIGEVGLGGEIRPVSQLERRIEESKKLHYKRMIVPVLKKLPKDPAVVQVSNVTEALKTLL